MSKTRKTSVTLPEDLIADLDELGSLLCVTRSSIITSVLQEAVPAMLEVFSLAQELLEYKEQGSEGAVVNRFRGESARLIEERMEAVRAAVVELKKG